MLTARTEVTDQMPIFGERHLRPILAEYARHCNRRDPIAAADSARPGLITPSLTSPGNRSSASLFSAVSSTDTGEPRRRPVGLEYTIVTVTCYFSQRRGLSGGDLVLVCEPAEDLFPADSVLERSLSIPLRHWWLNSSVVSHPSRWLRGAG